MPLGAHPSFEQPVENMEKIEYALFHALHQGKKPNVSSLKKLSDKSADLKLNGTKPVSVKSSDSKPDDFSPDDSKSPSSKSSVSEAKDDDTPTGTNVERASDMDVRVDLYIQDKDEHFKYRGHTLMGLQLSWNLLDICDAIQCKFQDEQELPLEKRPNLPKQTVWPSTHKVKKIASVRPEAVASEWDMQAVDQSTFFNPLNCTSLLRSIEQNRTPQTLAVYIAQQQDDYIY